MGNIRVEYWLSDRFSLHTVFGAGAAKLIVKDLSVLVAATTSNPTYTDVLLIDESDTEIAWQASIGTGIMLDDNLVFEIDYQNFMIRDPEFTDKGKNIIEMEYALNSVLVGIRIFYNV